MKKNNYTVGVLAAIALAAGACTKSVHEIEPLWKTKFVPIKVQGGSCSKGERAEENGTFTDRGLDLLLLNPARRREIGLDLLQGIGGITPNTYYRGLCYDVVAFARFLLDDSITSEDLTSYTGDKWTSRLGLDTLRRNEWDGQRPFLAGEIIGFYSMCGYFRGGGGGFYHAAIATGIGNQVRSVNYNLVNPSWSNTPDLREILGPRDPEEGTYNFDGRRIRIFIGNPYLPSESEMGNSIRNGTDPTTTPGPGWGLPPVLLPPPIGSPMMH